MWLPLHSTPEGRLQIRQDSATSTTPALGVPDGGAAVASPGTIKIVILVIVASVLLFGVIIAFLCCYGVGGKRSRFCICFGRSRSESPGPLSLSKNISYPELQQPLVQSSNLGTTVISRGGLAPRQEGRSWTDHIRQSMWMDRPRRSRISPSYRPVFDPAKAPPLPMQQANIPGDLFPPTKPKPSLPPTHAKPRLPNIQPRSVRQAPGNRARDFTGNRSASQRPVHGRGRFPTNAYNPQHSPPAPAPSGGQPKKNATFDEILAPPPAAQISPGAQRPRRAGPPQSLRAPPGHLNGSQSFNAQI